MPPKEDKTIKKGVRDLLISNSGLKANFVVLVGPDIGRKYEIKSDILAIGRAEESDICVNDDDVSREHAKVIVNDEAIFLEDLGSTNGTLVNGKRVSQHRLKDGDRIQIGNHTVFKFNFLDDVEDTFNEELYNAANRDFLTQIYNKKYFVDRLRMEFSYSRRHEVPLSLIIFDLDLFKRVNDTYGHAAGDYVLKELSAQIEAIKREEDLFARYGGEEFVLLLRATNEDSAVSIAEKIRSRIEEKEFQFEGHKLSITISIGVTTYRDENYKDVNEFFQATDSLLYDAKRAGGNYVATADQGPKRAEGGSQGSIL